MRALRLLRCRPFTTRMLALLIIILGFIIYCFYYTVSPSYPKPSKTINAVEHVKTQNLRNPPRLLKEPVDQCPAIRENGADIDTNVIYPSFNFQPSWLRTKEFWDKAFEDRYERMKNDTLRPRLKVIVVPHSHNDPGWLKTFEQYFEQKTKNIINNIVHKLQQHSNMTFVWTEMSFLNAWWERTHPVKQKAFKKLIKEGRLEITTGGWVMPDEACTHIYALVDQFIEGHTWVKTNLGITPKTGWSIDPFGHGPTVPYLLEQSGLEGTIIQRIHYAWKQWLAQRQIEEFFWVTGWSKHKPTLIVHNMPFDIYSIKSTCGPHPSVCIGFDFRKIPGEYSEYTAKYEEITDQNLPSKAKTLFEQYERIGSLTPHNVILVPLGDDFRYEYSIEFDAQYVNYMKMFNYINKHKDVFNADVSFGTPLDYFNAMKQRHTDIPSLKGDFFVYSDIFSEGKPAYWSGYYTTRPYLKILARQLEHQLRSAEIIFTLVSNYINQPINRKLIASEKRLEKSYEQLITARRNSGLFQHHDAITGTSKANVMSDYGTKLITSIYHCIRLQESALTTLMLPEIAHSSQSVLQSQMEWETYGKQPRQLLVSLVDKKKVILFNSLAEERTEVVTLRSNSTNVRVYDTRQRVYVPYQITPNIEIRDNRKFVISNVNFDIQFVATVPALSAVTFNLEEYTNTSQHCTVYCNKCNEKLQDSDSVEHFRIKKMNPGDIQLENSIFKLLIDRNTGLLRQIKRKDTHRRNIVDIQFGAYRSAQRHSGAYLFMPDYEDPERRDILSSYMNGNGAQDSIPHMDDNIVIVAGPVATEITTMYLPFLVHTIRIYTVKNTLLEQGVQIENIVDFENPPKNRETELFMRIQTNIQNGEVPEFYTDQNGFQYQKRVKITKLGIEGNYYPITTMAWLQDEETRLTLVTNHAQGASAFEPGRLELMMDRRTLYDDHRGVGEGVVDNKPTLFQNWLLLEPVAPDPARSKSDTSDHVNLNERHFVPDQNSLNYQLPSRTADYFSRTLNYPINVFLVDSSEVGEIPVASQQTFLKNFPPDVHILTLRTITDENLEQYPSREAFLVLHRPGISCSAGDTSRKPNATFTPDTSFNGLRINKLTSVSLTGLKKYHTLPDMGDIKLAPLEIKTYKIRF